MLKTYAAIDFRELVQNYSIFHDQRRRVVWLGVARCMEADAYDDHQKGKPADVVVVEGATTQAAMLELHHLRCKTLSARSERARDDCLAAARDLVGSDDVAVLVHYDEHESEYVARAIYPTSISGATWSELIRLLHANPIGALAQGADAWAPDRAFEALLAALRRMGRGG